MTDVEQKRIKAICKVAHIDDISDLSDGYHTFRQLYYQRMILFAVLVKQNRDKAWKSLRHENGELCFGGGWFIVGIDTPEGSYTYHYEDNYFGLFDCEELEGGKTWDGHTEKDVTRLLSLEQEPCEDEYIKVPKKALKYRTAGMVAYNAEWLKNHFDIERAVICGAQQPCDDAISRQAAIDAVNIGNLNPGIVGALQSILAELPPVTPQPKIGRWILKQRDKCIDICCSECGNARFKDYAYGYTIDELDSDEIINGMIAKVRTNYCECCGVKMQGVVRE